MVSSKAATVAAYLAELPPDRKKEVEKVRKVIRANLPPGYEEGMIYGMIGYTVPLSVAPDTYNGQPLCLAGLASQKNHLAVYLNNVYADRALLGWFMSSWKKSGKKLDMGKSCVRFKKADDLALDVLGESIARSPLEGFVGLYQSLHPAAKKKSAAKKKAPAKRKAPAKKKAKKRSA